MSHAIQASETNLRIENRDDGTFILDGWCQLGSIVYANFYESEADIPQTVIKIHVCTGKVQEAFVWTDGGAGRGRILESVNFKEYIRRKPIKPPAENKPWLVVPSKERR